MTRQELGFGLRRVNGNFGLDDRRDDFRRDGDRLIHKVRTEMMVENDIRSSLDVVLRALKEHGYISPRIYRYRESEDECVLMAYLDLPDRFKDEKVRSTVQFLFDYFRDS